MIARNLVAACRSVVGGLVFAFPLSGAAADNVPPETLSIKAFPDHYVASGKPFADLAALEAWARPIVIRSVWLDFCYPATTGELVSTVQRLHPVYSSGMQIRILSSGEAGCVPTVGRSHPTSAHVATVRADIEYLAADEFGRSTLP